MRSVITAAVLTTLLSACADMKEKIAESRQDRCERADWKEVGLRDGVEGIANQAERYQMICGELFQAAPYKEGLQQGLARRPRPPV
jgi:hypothetical protein